MKKWIIILLISLILVSQVLSSIFTYKDQLNFNDVDSCYLDAKSFNQGLDSKKTGQKCVDFDTSTRTCYEGKTYVNFHGELACGRNNLGLLLILKIVQYILLVGVLVCLFFLG